MPYRARAPEDGSAIAANGRLGSGIIVRDCNPRMVNAAVASVFAPHRLRVSRGAQALRFRLRADQQGITTVARVRYGTSVLIDADGLPGRLSISVPISGRMSLRLGSESFVCEPNKIWLTDDVPHQMNLSSGLELLSLIVSREAVENHLRRLVGEDLGARLTFAPIAENRHALEPVVALMSAAIEQKAADNLVAPLVTAHLDDLVLTTLLLTHPHNYSEKLYSAGRDGSPRVVRRVEAAIHDRPEYPWTAAELAAEAGASVRTVQLSFRTFRGCTPLEMLRAVRLERAHRDLLDPRPHDTVTTIGTRWGFTNMGRFAVAYRRRYDRSPGETLRGVGAAAAVSGGAVAPGLSPRRQDD